MCNLCMCIETHQRLAPGGGADACLAASGTAAVEHFIVYYLLYYTCVYIYIHTYILYTNTCIYLYIYICRYVYQFKHILKTVCKRSARVAGAGPETLLLSLLLLSLLLVLCYKLLVLSVLIHMIWHIQV